MPDIADAEKSQIRELAERYAFSIWKISFNEGLILCVKTNNMLHKHPSRWKYCLKCGEIIKKDLGEGKKGENHRCLMDLEDFPILIHTSWYKLKEFFLTNRYKEFMKEAGIDKIPSVSLIIETKEYMKEIEETKVPLTEKEEI